MTTPSHLSDVWFKVTDLQVESGQGCWVTTVDGTEYLDFAAGIAVVSTGQATPTWSMRSSVRRSASSTRR